MKFNHLFKEASHKCLFVLTFVTHERLSLEPYQTWQYCEVADIEPFQGQSDQIFQFSIIQNRVRIPFYLHANWKGAREDLNSLSLLSPYKEANGERERENPFVSSRFADRGLIKAERARARERKKMCKWKRKNGNLWTRLSERCPPSWSRLTTGVDQRNFAITLLPSSFLPIYLSIYLALFHSFFYSRSLSPPIFPLLARFVPLIPGLPSYSFLLCFAHTIITIVFILFLYI